MSTSLSHDLKAFLHQQGRLRVWSIIVTIMGDVVETTGGTISIAALIDICTSLDIEPQAVRTAMSRLTKEGWVERIPDGRSTLYRFSDHRRGEYNDATRTIYACPTSAPKGWITGVLPPWTQTKKQALITAMGAVHPMIINQHIAVWADAYDSLLPDDCRAVLTIFHNLPETMAHDALDHISPSPQDELITVLLDFGRRVQHTDTFSAEDALIIRIIMIHFWRRLVLRHIPIHSPFGEETWPLPKLHALMAETYPALAKQSASYLSDEVDEDMVISRFQQIKN